MTEKNTITLVIVAVIGAIGAILAACIGLIPTILPMVRVTSTPLVFDTATTTPSFTPLPETPSATFVPPTETPTETPTLQSSGTSTETPTTVPTLAASSSNINDYVGTWVNVDDQPGSDKVQMIVTRIEITRTGDSTTDLDICRYTKDGEFFVQPHPAPAVLYDFAILARDLTIPRIPDRKWTVLVQQSGEQIVATVQEFDQNNILLNLDTFRLEQPGLLESVGLGSCEEPPVQGP